MEIGEPIGDGIDRKTVMPKNGCRIIWPIRTNGDEGRWQLGVEKLREAYSKGYVKLGKFTRTGMAISYLRARKS